MKRRFADITILVGVLLIIAASAVLCHQGFCVFYSGFDDGFSQELEHRGSLIMKLSMLPLVGLVLSGLGFLLAGLQKKKESEEPGGSNNNLNPIENGAPFSKG